MRAVVTVVALVIIVGSMLPVVCVGVPVHGDPASNMMPAGCHGTHVPARAPAHSCCRTSGRQPAALPIATFPALTLHSEVASVDVDRRAAAVDRAAINLDVNSSPPLPAVLRI